MSLKQLDNRLMRDCHFLREWNGIAILLHKNAYVPWFILVPLSETGQYRELFELPAQQRLDLQKASDVLSKFLINSLGSEKINVAAIGNVVEQLHQHVVGRRKDDSCWPNPVWGNLMEGKEYDDAALAGISGGIAGFFPND